VEAKHTASSFFHGHPIVQEEEDQEQDNQHSSSATDNQDQRNGATRGRGGARGRGATSRNPNQPRGVVQSKDADGFNQYHQGNDGKILLNERGHHQWFNPYVNVKNNTKNLAAHASASSWITIDRT
jgi:hypothetical protein